jgi:hypothetical protein
LPRNSFFPFDVTSIWQHIVLHTYAKHCNGVASLAMPRRWRTEQKKPSGKDSVIEGQPFGMDSMDSMVTPSQHPQMKK